MNAYEQMKQRNALALQLMNQNRVDPNQGPWSAVANLGQTLASAFMARRGMDQESALLDQMKKEDSAKLAAALTAIRSGDVAGGFGAIQSTSEPERMLPLANAMLNQQNRLQDRTWTVDDRNQSRGWQVQDMTTQRGWDVADQNSAFNNSKALTFLQSDLTSKRDQSKRAQELQDQERARGYQVEDRNFNAQLALAGKEADRQLEASPLKATEAERSSAGYLGRVLNAEKIIGDLQKEGFNPGSTWEKMRGATNVTASKDFQLYRQAQEDWVRAKLRKESGAVIGDEEMEREIRVYFPQLGDSDEVIEQKALSRAEAAKQLEISAGRAAGQAYEPPSMPSWMTQEDIELLKKYQ